VLLALLNTYAALHLRPEPSSLKDSIDDLPAEDKEADDADYKSELEASLKFVPSTELLAAWKDAFAKKFSGKQFSKAGVSLPSQCADQVVKWAEAANPPEKRAPDASFILSHPECADPWAGKESCGKAFEVPLYRLGDVVLYRPLTLPAFTRYFFPKSIGAKYVKETHKKNDIAVLNQIISGKEYDDFEKPADNEVVVHLRLGDAYQHMKMKNTHYASAISKIRHSYPSVSSVTLVYGDHHMKQMQILGGHENFSRNQKRLEETDNRIAQIEKMFTDKGFKVTKRLNHNADCDVIYMANSKFLIKAGGGFSQLIGSLVQKRGGKVFG